MFDFLILSFSLLTDVLAWTLSTLHLVFGTPITDHWTVQWSTTIQTKLIWAYSTRSVYLSLFYLNSSYNPYSERPLHNTLHQALKQALSLGLFDFKLICQANIKHCTYQQVARARFFLAIQTYQLFTQHTDTITQKGWTKAKFHRRQQLCRD